ncbi:ATP-dependent RecD-like DNA helicase [Ethanoligenens sp.]|uniref:SF1B family DNA helicase RecD2 n=1 Tax=Ethanoligenens sp. TaxID=2099655 RepID=UPI0039EB0352
MGEQETLRGTVESVVFRNRENGWTVFEMACGETLCTVVGHVFEVAEGETLTVKGEWGKHPSYGKQFKAESFEREMPATSAAMLRYLSSGAVRGIGPAIAKRMVDVFGVETLDILENTPERLTQVKGISEKKALEMSDAYKSQFGVRTCMLFLQQYGVTAAQSIRVWKRFGANAVEIVKRNPYVLCESGLYIGFERADDIAMQMGVDKGDAFRIHAGIAHILRHNLYAGGHTYIPLEKLAHLAQTLLGVTVETAAASIEDMVNAEEAVDEEINGRRVLFLPESHRAETYIAGRLLLMHSIKLPEMGDCETRIHEVETRLGIAYAKKQREAIETAYRHNVMILTGGPGTGKTTTLNAIIHIYEGMGLKVALAAPTGRAAKRMADVSQREAKTIHRLLEMSFENDDTARFMRNEKNPLDCDAVIVDELSMVDVMLLESLLCALKLSCRLVMVGDADQLPPVGAGNALRDMIDSGKVPTVVLDEIFRQAAKSLIVTNAHRIVRGQMPEMTRHDGDFFFMPRYTAAQVSATVVELMHERLPAAYGYSPLWDMQVLTPGRKGELGSNAFNKLLQDVLNPADHGKAERPAAFGVLREGDKVMQIKNNYDLAWQRDNGEQGAGVFNGDVGQLERVDRRTGALRVRYDDRIAEYSPDHIEELELAYAVTVHKSQGSEFKAVVLPLFSGAPMLFYRNLLYTAVTRAKEITVLVGRKETVEQMVQNDRRSKRYTGLCAFLQAGEVP